MVKLNNPSGMNTDHLYSEDDDMRVNNRANRGDPRVKFSTTLIVKSTDVFKVGKSRRN